MRNTRRIAVISQDTLRATGLQNMLVSYFSPVETDLFSVEELENGLPGDYDYYFIDEGLGDAYGLMLSGVKVMRLSAGQPGCGTCRLDVFASVQEILSGIEAFFSDGCEDQERSKILTDREIQVLRQIASGAINKEIADRLSISFNTVLTHRKNITAKTGIKTVSGLTFYAIINGYVSPSDIEF